MSSKQVKSTALTAVATKYEAKIKNELFKAKEKFDETIEDIWYEEYLQERGIIVEEADVAKGKEARGKKLVKKRDYYLKKGIIQKEKRAHRVENAFYNWAKSK